jgi:hypothetical protein
VSSLVLFAVVSRVALELILLFVLPLLPQVTLTCRMAHLMFDCLTYTGGPSYSLLRFLQKYIRLCSGKSARIKALLENRQHFLASVPEADAWVPPVDNIRHVDFAIVSVINSVDHYAHSSQEGVHAVRAVCSLLQP